MRWMAWQIIYGKPCHVIGYISSPEMRVQHALDDVADNIWQALPTASARARYPSHSGVTRWSNAASSALASAASAAAAETAAASASAQGLTLVPISAQLERFCVQPSLTQEYVPELLKLSSNVDECKPCLRGGGGGWRTARGRRCHPP